MAADLIRCWPVIGSSQMSKMFVCVFVLISSLAFSGEAKKVENTLRSFTTEGCSVIPDFQMTDCCILHDLAYWKGGSSEDRLKADQDLASCVAEKSNSLFGSMFYLGVRLGGSPDYLTGYHWGYGWKYTRPYRSLSNEEMKQVKAMMPSSPLKQKISEEGHGLGIVPAKFGDYCMNEIYDYVEERYSGDVSIVKLRKASDYYLTKVKLSLDNGEKVIFTYKNNKWDQCKKPIYYDEVPRFYLNISIRK